MRCEATFTGRVQGVGFRMVTREVAERQRLSGWVRNEADGSVSAVFEGTHDAIDACLAEIGERMERFISSSRSSRFDDERGYDGFEIRG